MPFGIGDAVDNPDSAALVSQAGPGAFCDIEDRSVAANLAFVIIVDKEIDDDERDAAADISSVTVSTNAATQRHLHAQKAHERRHGARMLRRRAERQNSAELGIVAQSNGHDECVAELVFGCKFIVEVVDLLDEFGAHMRVLTLVVQEQLGDPVLVVPLCGSKVVMAEGRGKNLRHKDVTCAENDAGVVQPSKESFWILLHYPLDVQSIEIRIVPVDRQWSGDVDGRNGSIIAVLIGHG